MNVTDEETKRFLKLIDPTYRSDMCDILSNMHAMHAPIVFVRMLNDDIFSYHGNYILVISEDTAFNSKVVVFDQTFAKFKEDNAEFITSYISRRFNNLKLIFSSSMTRIFAENTSVINVAISCLDNGVFITKLFSNNNYVGTVAFGLSENNADFSNEIWDIALSDRSNVNHMMSAYISGKYYASDNIKKRIQALYESLSDSDKLLLELGEDI